MKKSIKKLTLNKKMVSDLTCKVRGGFKDKDPIKTIDTILTTQTTDPTAQTLCFICPPEL